MLKIDNNGPDIVYTNYWDTEHAQRGYLYLSWNAGAARLLVPDVQIKALPDMRSAAYVIISRGPWREQGGCDALELLFEDDTDSPFSITLRTEQTDRLLPETNQGARLVVGVWTRSGKQMEFSGRYRIVASIPSLQSWSEG